MTCPLEEMTPPPCCKGEEEGSIGGPAPEDTVESIEVMTNCPEDITSQLALGTQSSADFARVSWVTHGTVHIKNSKSTIKYIFFHQNSVS